MISTGAEALDSRLGSLRRGGLYVVHGPAAAGKSVIGLHFLMHGLDSGEQCLLITRDEPAMIDSRALFVGYNAGLISEHPGLTVARIPAVLPSRHGLSPGQSFVHWLQELSGGAQPSRIVLDSVDWLARYSHAPLPLLHEIRDFVTRDQATTFALIRSPRGVPLDATAYEPLLHHAAAVFALDIAERGARRFHFRSPPDGAFRTDDFGYSLRAGGGFSEEHELHEVELSDAERQRLVVVDDGIIAGEVYTSLEAAFEVVRLPSAVAGLKTLFDGRYGALIMTVDPFDEMRTFDIAFELRREGNPVPIVLVAPSRGLRGSTRARGLRAGADDFVVADMPTDAMIDRIRAVWTSGSHSRSGMSQTGHIVQPVHAGGVHRLMSEEEFRQAMETLLGVQPALFFCYVEFRIDAPLELIWPALRSCVRVGQGDIVGVVGHDTVGMALDRITPEQVVGVMSRIRDAHDALARVEALTVHASPMDTEVVRERLLSPGRAERSLAGS